VKGAEEATVFGANLSRPTGSFGQRQKPGEEKERPKGKSKTGTSYFAKNRNFLLCLDMPPGIVHEENAHGAGRY
jgi:hypothetical protein